jgi:hypothetical protein
MDELFDINIYVEQQQQKMGRKKIAYQLTTIFETVV